MEWDNGTPRADPAAFPPQEYHASLHPAVQLGTERVSQGVTVILGLSEGTEVGHSAS